MKKITSKFIVALFVLMCLALPVFVGNMETEAADPTYVVEEYSFDKASPYFKNDTPPTKEGYVFAGWYAADDIVVTDATTGEGYFEGTPLVTLVGYMHETVQALFVEESVLAVKGQIAITEETDDENADVTSVTEGATADLRLVTSVDSLKYQKVGFDVSYTYNGTAYTKESVTNYVYKQLKDVNGTDATDEVFTQPNQIFSTCSQYFKACTVSGIPYGAFETGLSVQAYWITADGATVYGTEVIKSVQDGIYDTYEAGVGETYYKVLEDAVASVAASETEATVTLFKDAEVASDMEITGQVKVTNRAGANVTIYRAAELTSANVFSVADGGTLTIEGTTDENSIVLDGRTAGGTEVNGASLVYSDTSTLSIKNATLQNAKNTTTNDGGAIHAKAGTLSVENVKFIDNYSNYGAAIRTTAPTTITNCNFGEENKGNVAVTQGGAVYNNGTTIDIYDSNFVYNKATTGGAIVNNAGTIVIENTKFAYNEAVKNGGAINTNKGSSLTLTAKEGDTLAVFLANKVTNGETNTNGGGAINMSNGSLSITGYRFENNSSAKLAGAIRTAAGTRTITGATFIGNYTTGDAGWGGAIFIGGTGAKISHTKFEGNYTNGSEAHGGALYLAKPVANTTLENITYISNAVNGSGSEGADIYSVE